MQLLHIFKLGINNLRSELSGLYKSDLVKIVKSLGLPFSGKGKDDLCRDVTNHFINDKNERNAINKLIEQRKRKASKAVSMLPNQRKKRLKMEPNFEVPPVHSFSDNPFIKSFHQSTDTNELSHTITARKSSPKELHKSQPDMDFPIDPKLADHPYLRSFNRISLCDMVAQPITENTSYPMHQRTPIRAMDNSTVSKKTKDRNHLADNIRNSQRKDTSIDEGSLDELISLMKKGKSI